MDVQPQEKVPINPWLSGVSPKNGMGYGAIGTYGLRLIFPAHQICGLDFAMG
jgi:hypothetical protein